MSTALPTPSIDEILQDYEYKPEQVESISERRQAMPLAIVEPKPDEWAARFAALEAKIRAALSSDDGSNNKDTVVLAVTHVGSTAVAGLAAKDVIDIDLTVADPDNEPAYVAPLERHGFHFKNREVAWHRHRFFLHYGEGEGGGSEGGGSNGGGSNGGDSDGGGSDGGWCNLHVWGPGCPETRRHLLRDWLRAHEDDRVAYAGVKRAAAEATIAIPGGAGSVMDYNARKQDFIRGLLRRIFVAEGYIREDGDRQRA